MRNHRFRCSRNKVSFNPENDVSKGSGYNRSPKKKDNTYQLTKKVEKRIKQFGDVEFEYVFLKDLDLKTCKGCQICFNKGEDLCPLKDDMEMVEEKMHKAEGIIFTLPNYVFNVSGIMKNFIDSRRKISDFSGLQKFAIFAVQETMFPSTSKIRDF